ncbi:acetyl-CoA synthetase-like protein [Suhomyces tanzawaensis NRRL Y-17324]|uniref:Acetyl-CoA synthetase-like protein n=1 Tax=Suhomyces tanzawaensis NRRL Y-17324 TaxID=984487 RepID=A0A1E4SJI2_9ASCO|nr:acetyl-CoA synthetase-like protein [Suhomyces tanzawaensis NRRL Y-17324]ODV79597.1 acetyl-CoA synthetase-like protein [Suhomyces tanzawaensis NRRL Y-17324]
MAPVTVAVGEAKAGETAPRRKLAQKDGAVERPYDSKATNLVEFLDEVVHRNSSRPAMGWRDLLEVHTETKKVTKFVDGKETKVDKDWTFYEYSKYNYITYKQLGETVRHIAAGLVAAGLEPNQKDKLHLFAGTSKKWLQSFLAASHISLPVVTAYDTLGESGLTHSLVQTESNAVFTDNTLLSQLIRPLQKATSVKYIIHSEPIDEGDKRLGGKFYKDAVAAKEKLLEVRPDLKFFSFDEIIELGKETPLSSKISPKSDDTACIMYTSGSTGDPKGVVITHANIIAAVGGVSSNVGRKDVKPHDRIIAFLPLAHIFELVFEFSALWWGGTLGYANVKTLTEASCKNCQSDLQEFKPTIMVGVAAVWESVRKGVLAKVRALPALTQKIFWAAYKAKTTFSSYHIPGASIFDIIFKKIKAATGGELRIIMNGGSPISKDTQVFISTLIAPMLIGYGLTETCAQTTICEVDHFEYDVAGTLTGAVTAKLVDVADAGYYAKHNQGEILLSGKSIVKEYYKNEKETAEAFTEDGWFRTGDIGEWTANGNLRVIDRKKNLVKTLNGEYIALEKLESVYRSNPVVLNLCAYADQSKVKPIAIVLPNEQALKSLLIDERIYSKDELSSKELSHLCEEKKVADAVQKSLAATGKSQGLKGIEIIQAVVLLDDEWTPQNGFVTSAQKLQRKKILESCKEKVEAAYDRS